MSTQHQSDAINFQHARAAIEDGTDRAGGIAQMIHLSWYAQPLTLRSWAARYLEAELQTSVQEGGEDETQGTPDQV